MAIDFMLTLIVKFHRFKDIDIISRMGKGDKKTKRGKIANKSYGARRPGRIKKRATVEQKIRLKKKA